MQMARNSDLNRKYYNQIFESLQAMWKSTKEQIIILEQRANFSLRYKVQAMTVRSSQANVFAGKAACAIIETGPMGTGVFVNVTNTVR